MKASNTKFFDISLIQLNSKMSLPRFGLQNDEAIDKIIEENTPKKTVNSKKYTWKIFMEFCYARKYDS